MPAKRIGLKGVYLLALALDAGLEATERAVKYSESFLFRAGLLPDLDSLLLLSVRVASSLVVVVFALAARLPGLCDVLFDLFDWAISFCLARSSASAVAISRRVAVSDSRFCSGVRASCTFTTTPSVQGFWLYVFPHR